MSFFPLRKRRRRRSHLRIIGHGLVIVSTVKRSREQPKWNTDTVWKDLYTLWQTKRAKKRSKTASKARNSDQKGLGPHQHLSGQKSYTQIQDEMEGELGRPVTFGEVFLKTHTRPDGTFVDEKAK